MKFAIFMDNFSIDLIPIHKDLLKTDPSLFEKAVQNFFSNHLKWIGGTINAKIHDTVLDISINCGKLTDAECITKIKDYVFSLLNADRIYEAVPLLEMLLSDNPEDAALLYNLGMIYSDSGKLDLAEDYLYRVVHMQPENANGWVAYGVALHRKGSADRAISAFREALKIEPDNPYAAKNYAAALAKMGDLTSAKQHFENAYKLLPNDAGVLFGLGQCLFDLQEFNKADHILSKVIKLNQNNELAEAARELRSKISHTFFRDEHPIRMDAVMYCLAALERFDNMPKSDIQRIAYEIALLGRSGLDVNDPTPKYTLENMNGEFTGLQLVSYMYVGFKKLDPELSVGFDLSNEYLEAKKLLGLKK